jgi:Ras association domain-containing protein 9/10
MNEQEAEIPVWIEGSEKLMTGLTKRTTCDDVIYSLLLSQGISNGDVETYNYMVVERWRKMERPLQGRAKIVKVWKAWGPERQNVNFVVRKLEIPAAAMIRSRRTRKPNRRQRGVEEFYDPEKVRAEKMRVQNIEDLVHLVREQQRRMNEQFSRIHETDTEIDQFETKVHLQRISKRGLNYVQDSYLSLHSLSDDSSHGSGLEDALSNSIRESELEMYLKICDNILQLEEKITMGKNKLEDLHFQIEEISNCGSDLDADLGQSGVGANEGKLIRDKLNISMSLTDYNHNELHKLSMNISECDNALRRKHEYMEYLMKELEAAERAEASFQGQGQTGYVMQYGAIYAVRGSAGSDSSEISNIQSVDNSLERVHVPIVGSLRPEDRFSTRINSCNSSADSNESSPPTVRTVRFSDSSSTSDDRGYFSPVLEKCAEYPITPFPRPLKSILKHTAHSFSCNDLRAVVKTGYDDNDSNSDTGLSSLHSDEAMPILETLV